MRLLIKFLTLPFRLLFGIAGFVLRVAGFTFGFSWRALGFFSGQALAIIAGVLIGFFFSRKHLRAAFFSGRKK